MGRHRGHGGITQHSGFSDRDLARIRARLRREQEREEANVAEANQISAAAAVQILKNKAQTLEECARDVMLDRPDLYRKWTREARQLRITAGEDPDDESED